MVTLLVASGWLLGWFGVNVVIYWVGVFVAAIVTAVKVTGSGDWREGTRDVVGHVREAYADDDKRGECTDFVGLLDRIGGNRGDQDARVATVEFFTWNVNCLGVFGTWFSRVAVGLFGGMLKARAKGWARFRLDANDEERGYFRALPLVAEEGSFCKWNKFGGVNFGGVAALFFWD